MKIVVGVPVFRVVSLVRDCLRSLVGTGAEVVIVDNAADQDVKQVVADYAAKGATVITSPTNEYCNGGWNRILKYGLENGADIIGLGSSDAMLHEGWCKQLERRAQDHADEVWIPEIGDPIPNVDDRAEAVTVGIAGFFTFLPRKAAESIYPIPAELRHWFGDQYMFEKLRAEGWKITILHSIRASHQQSAITAATPESYAIIEQDKLAWSRR